MATLTELNLFPIKSCGGLSLSQAVLTEAGLRLSNGAAGDREWMLVDEKGQFLTQRTHPRMALIAPVLHESYVELRAPGMLPLEIALDLPKLARTTDVRVWRDNIQAVDYKAETAAWTSEFLGIQCSLVRFHQDAIRIASPRRTGNIVAPMLFNDSFPLLVIGQSSLDDLNWRLRAAGRDELPMNRFRPNLVVDGLEPYEEDRTATLRIGDAVIRLVRPCQRCPVPAVDQNTGIPGPDPLDILRTYRANPEMNGAIVFGMHAIVTAGAGNMLHVGQQIDVSADG